MTSRNLQDLTNSLREQDKAFFDKAFTKPTTGEPYQIPPELRRLSERLCRSYGINGICDPMYIANVIAFELGIGDGNGQFSLTRRERKPYQPKTGHLCSCKPGQQRDNCPRCEGTDLVVDFVAIRAITSLSATA